MKVTTIADALKCAAKINAGKACTAAEMRATIKLLDTGLKTSRRTVRELKRQLTRSDGLVQRLMGKIGL
jgi:signal transduction histidine kinase